MGPFDFGSLEFWQFFVTQTSMVWGLIGLVRRGLAMPSPEGAVWRNSETGQFMSAWSAMWMIFTFVASLLVTLFLDWPVMAGLIPWQQIGVIQSNFILDGSVWLYNLLFATLSSLYKTVVAIFSAGAAALLNLLR